MGSGKHSNSDTSSEENDDNTGIGRSYECTFCKRGFTNAQALGGHMNIHRKDKAKAKAKVKQTNRRHQQDHDQTSLINKSHDEDLYNNTAPKYFAPISSEQQQYSTAVAAYMSYQLYFPGSNNGYNLHTYHHQDLLYSRSDPEHHLSMHDCYMDQSLSLRIGPPCMEDVDERKIGMNEKEVDLELRLGHHP
ncbi:hypothetical protein ACH5RR_031454 [Cinchona calisaya]|uniref:C2H2-type domain-containing protein n=1 Tax=Cinchona calisaya TaxID=153742 RepID=A0ABD2YJP9_9GENT